MNVSGKTVFVMLFGIAVAVSVDLFVGVFVFLALWAASNPQRVVQIFYALDDTVQRAQRLIEERRCPVLASGSDEGEGVTTARIIKEEPAVVTPAPTAPTPAPAPAAVTTPRIHKEEAAVVTLPPPSRFDPSEPRPSRFAVPLGYDQAGVLRWLDFGRDALHIGLYGTSGCGKDHLLRLWFASLLHESAVRWAILDGKGDWLTPNLARLSQMLFPPAGGYGENGQRRIREAIDAVNEEAKRRFGLLLDAGVRSVEEYNQLADEPLPLLIVLATDIIDVVDETERLLIALVSKARALGIRVIVSMQTPTGKRLEWRMNLSTLIAGALVDGSQDAPALGVRDPKALRFRPSQLPPPPAERGLFVVRHNNEQFLVRTPTLAGDFDQIVNEYTNSALLEALLAESVTTPRISKEEIVVVTVDEQTPTSARQNALGRTGEVDLALENAGTGSVPSQSQLRRVETVVSASQSDGTVSISSPSQPSSSQTQPKPPDSGDFGDGDGDGDGDSELVAALAALQRVGLSREKARVFGFRFRNEDWARAARLVREKDV